MVFTSASKDGRERREDTRGCDRERKRDGDGGRTGKRREGEIQVSRGRLMRY